MSTIRSNIDQSSTLSKINPPKTPTKNVTLIQIPASPDTSRASTRSSWETRYSNATSAKAITPMKTAWLDSKALPTPTTSCLVGVGLVSSIHEVIWDCYLCQASRLRIEQAVAVCKSQSGPTSCEFLLWPDWHVLWTVHNSAMHKTHLCRERKAKKPHLDTCCNCHRNTYHDHCCRPSLNHCSTVYY